MAASLYQELTAARAEMRPRVKAEPRITQGVMQPSAAGTFEDTPLARSLVGAEMWMKVALAMVVDAGEFLGWEKYVNLIDTEQRKSKDKGAKGAVNLIKQYGIEGDNVMSAVATMVAHAMGGGFSYHKHTKMTEKSIEAFAGWCAMVEGVRDLGIADRAQNLRLFCDAFDDLNTQIVNPNIWMIHSHCPLNGDKYCRFYVDELDEQPKGKNYYEKVKYLNDKKFEEVEASAPEPDFYQGITSPRFIEKLSPEYISNDGVITWGRIAHETIVILARAMGWENFFNAIGETQTWGMQKMALKSRTQHDIQGSSIRSAGIAVAYNYAAMGFEDHHIIEFTDEKVEAVGHTCPIIESLQRLELDESEYQDISLWCDYFHNQAVQGVNKDARICHTHCLGRGDTYCRFRIEMKDAAKTEAQAALPQMA